MKLLAYSLLFSLLTACATPSTIQKTQSAIVKWGSPEGISRLAESNYKVDFFKLANQFESQNNKLFCGPASAAIVLNALRIRNSKVIIPQDTSLLNSSDMALLSGNKWSPFFQRYTQNNVFIASPKTRAAVLGAIAVNDKQKAKPAKDYGFQLRQLNALFKQHSLETQLRVVSDTLTIKIIKQEIISNLKTADDYVLVNYKRGTLKQAGGGHISPLAAYHKASDSFLVLDVTPNKADWIWVQAELLITAMRTFDTVENRGYLLLREGGK